ncbi:hypothetical protein ACLB2K_036484 [Fragaria x ananassa]
MYVFQGEIVVAYILWLPLAGKRELGLRYLNPVKNSYLLKILSVDAINRVEDLIEIQEVQDRLKNEFYKERGALEARYEKSYEPLYEQRYYITNGVNIDCESTTINQEGCYVYFFFFFFFFRGNDALNDMIMDHDEGVLKHLDNVKWFRTDNLRVFKLEFYFRPNPFFKNSILTVTYHMIDDDDSIIEKIIGPTEVHDKHKDLKLKYEMQENCSIGLSPGVNILKNIQSDHDELKKMFNKERANIEAKYQNLFQNLFHKCQMTPKPQLVKGILQIEMLHAPEGKGIPNFWRHALVNHELLDAEITSPDGRALMYLKDIRCSKIDKGFKLEFFFNKNPYFKNSVLIKTYEYLDEDLTFVHKVTGSKIEWYPENCLTSKVNEKPKKKLESVRPEQCESFFNFFDPLPIDIKAPKEHINEMRRDLYIGLTIRDEIIPRAVLWYVGDGAQGKMDIDFGESEDEEGDENLNEDEYDGDDSW